MRRRTALLASAIAAAGLGGAIALTPPRGLEDVRYGREACRIAAPEAPGGLPLTGIEDLALLPDGSLLASAQDRLGDGPAGIFVIDPSSPDGPARAVSGLPPGAKPHGIALSPDGGTLAVVNRAPGGAEILVGGLSDGRFEERLRLTGAAYCRANDLAFSDAALFVTLDRASCGLSLRDLAPGARTGRVLRIDPDGAATVALDDLAFPNGVAPWNGGLAIAETRADRLRADEDALELPGGPDNLTALADGRLLVALHPALLRLALRRAGLPCPLPAGSSRSRPAAAWRRCSTTRRARRSRARASRFSPTAS